MSADLRETLHRGAEALSLSLDERQLSLLMDYLALIQKWNQVYNLTSLRDPAEMLTHHLLDSLAVIAPLRAQLQTLTPCAQHWRLLDVGSGAGLPGVVLAICCPDIGVTCVDTVGKKAAFIQQVAVSLKLPNLRGLHARVETLKDGYDVVSSRAFASLLDFTQGSKAALAPAGIWLAMKGKQPVEEMAQLPKSVQVFHVEQLHVPELPAERCIVWMRHDT
jgi:16S rRNA (guanine527-N7)-methyltransferase